VQLRQAIAVLTLVLAAAGSHLGLVCAVDDDSARMSLEDSDTGTAPAIIPIAEGVRGSDAVRIEPLEHPARITGRTALEARHGSGAPADATAAAAGAAPAVPSPPLRAPPSSI
jgi:hypothetical protein